MPDTFYPKEVIHRMFSRYDTKIKESINNNKGILIYNNYIDLPDELEKETIAYCKNPYIVSDMIIHDKGLYFYDIDKLSWELLPSGANMDDLENMILLKSTYGSTHNDESVKYADELYESNQSQPLSYYGKNNLGEVGFHLLPINTGLLEVGEMEQRILNNVSVDDSFVIESINDLSSTKIFIQCFGHEDGLTDLEFTLDSFTGETSKNIYYYNQDTITFSSEGVSVKNDYKFTPTTNDKGLYEYVIDKSKFAQISKVYSV